MNYGAVDGVVGRWERKDKALFVRLCHKESWFDGKENAWRDEDHWMTVTFFGAKGDALERRLEKGLRMVVEYTLSVFPKDGPQARIRLNARSFHILEKRSQLDERLATKEAISEEAYDQEATAF